MNPARLWPFAIVAVLALTVGANVVLFVAARDGRGLAIEPDYYRKAVAWDSTLAQERRNDDLGWRLDARLGDPGPRGASLAVDLLDRDGLPLDGAEVRVEAIHNAIPGPPVSVALKGLGGGSYEARLPLPRSGMWELRFAVQRAGEHFTARLRRDTGWITPRS